jgi:hypothetical protein
MLMRRRPIARAAMLGGVGYASYRAGQRRQDQDSRGAVPDAEPAQPGPQAAPAPAAQTPANPGAQRVEALSKLKELLDAGVLSQDEFDAEKQRILRGE